jgi:hypothetical protein
MGDPSEQRRLGPIQYAAEYFVARRKGSSFPALLLVQGTEFRLEGHSIEISHPVVVSWDGLHGGIRTARPDTRISIRSPAIHSGDIFVLDSEKIAAETDGVLVLKIPIPGEHRFSEPQ